MPNRPENLCCSARQIVDISQTVAQLLAESGSADGNPADRALKLRHGVHETFIVTTLCRLRRRCGAAAAQLGACLDLDLSAHTLTACRLQLPSSTHLFSLRRRGDRALRVVGRRLDDACSLVALSSLGHIGNRQRPADKTCGRTLVSTVALWTLARRQRAVSSGCTALNRKTYCGSGTRVLSCC